MQEYREALARLLEPATYTGVPDLAPLTPHLTDEMRAQMVAKAAMGAMVFFALPPLRVGGRYHTAHIYQMKGVWHLSYGTAVRAQSSTLQTNGMLAEHWHEAIAYAEHHWGGNLVWDNSAATTAIPIATPDEYHRGQDTTVWYTTCVSLTEMWNNHSKPRSEVWNDAIVHTTLNYFEAVEFSVERSYHQDPYHCARCGAGQFTRGRCTNCDPCRERSYTLPLPQKIVDLLEAAGYAFEINPSVAREAERREWARAH